ATDVAQHFAAGAAPFLIAGPCVVESDDLNRLIGETVAELGVKLGVHVIYKASFDKANRSRLGGSRTPVCRSSPMCTRPSRCPRPLRWRTCCRSPPFSAARPICSSPQGGGADP